MRRNNLIELPSSAIPLRTTRIASAWRYMRDFLNESSWNEPREGEENSPGAQTSGGRSGLILQCDLSGFGCEGGVCVPGRVRARSRAGPASAPEEGSDGTPVSRSPSAAWTRAGSTEGTARAVPQGPALRPALIGHGKRKAVWNPPALCSVWGLQSVGGVGGRVFLFILIDPCVFKV